MPAKAPHVSPDTATSAVLLGQQIRERRKALGVSATVAAESAGMSRVTWHRIEHGELSVTMGAYLAALQTLDLYISAAPPTTPAIPDDSSVSLPLHIPLANYPQLQRLAWQVQGVDTLSPREALGIYERNWRHIDTNRLEPHEQQLIKALRQVLGQEGSHV